MKRSDATQSVVCAAGVVVVVMVVRVLAMLF
jgi:hypothetical protein